MCLGSRLGTKILARHPEHDKSDKNDYDDKIDKTVQIDKTIRLHTFTFRILRHGAKESIQEFGQGWDPKKGT